MWNKKENFLMYLLKIEGFNLIILNALKISRKFNNLLIAQVDKRLGKRIPGKPNSICSCLFQP